MKLKKVTVSFEYVMVVDDNLDYAETVRKANSLIKDVVRDMSMYDFDVDVQDVNNNHSNLPAGWDDLCLPYGTDDDRPIYDY